MLKIITHLLRDSLKDLEIPAFGSLEERNYLAYVSSHNSMLPWFKPNT